MRTLSLKTIALGALATLIAGAGARAQSSSEIEQLRREYDQQLRVMQQAFEERMSALEGKMDKQKNDEDFNWYWHDGLHFDTADGRFKLKFNGRIQWDNAFFDEDSDAKALYGDFMDGAEFRRSRIEIAGDIYKDYFFKAQYDFTDTTASFKDVYLGVKTPIGKFTAGHFHEPFSLDELTSSKDIQFMERALPNVFVPGRNAGIGYSNAFADDMVTVAGGIFRNAGDGGDSDVLEDEWSLTGRVTARPWVTEEGDKYIHLGAGASYRSLDDKNSTLHIRQRPEAHLSDHRLVDTGEFGLPETGNEELNSAVLYNAEAALVYGPFAAQGEYIHMDVNTDTLNPAGINDPSFDGYYLQASYFITGEHRRYKASDGKFDKVKPNKNFQITGDSGPGAWEVAARYSHLDLDDKVDGGTLDDITLGVNWYLNPNMKMMFNYVRAMSDDIGPTNDGGDLNIFQTRFQVTW